MKIHPKLRLALEIGGALAELTEMTVKQSRRALRRPRRGYESRQPGAETPLWNICAAAVRAQVRPWGAQARLARYLGIPRQRLQDYLRTGARLPDAEIALQLLYWLVEKRRGVDMSTFTNSLSRSDPL